MVTSRIGVEGSRTLDPDLTLRGRAAWGHRYGDGGSIIATAATLTQVLPSADGDRDWAEGGVGLNYQLSDQTAVSADLSGREGKTQDSAVMATVGIVWRWD